MNPPLNQRETGLAAALAALVLLALFAPALAQPAHYGEFADTRTLAGIPFAMDTLTNLAFAAWGVVGLVMLARLAPGALPRVQGQAAVLFFWGLIATAFGSAWYHAQPADAGLVLDRLCMVPAFSGLLALAAAERVRARAGSVLAGLALLLGGAAVADWALSGNVLPWALFQFGGMALLLAAAMLPASGPTVRWPAILLLYGLAKAFELTDAAVYEFTAHLISGHSLKHLVGALAAWPVIHALRARRALVPDPAASRSRPAATSSSSNDNDHACASR